MSAPFAKVPHSAVMITTARELRVYVFRCATANPKTGLSRWPVERLAVRMGLTYDSVAKAEKALVKLGFLGRGEDEKGQYWQPKDPDPMNLWLVQRSEYIPRSDGNHAEVCTGEVSEDSIETIRGQHRNHPNSDSNRPRSARVEDAKPAVVGKGAGVEELVEESTKELTKELGEDAAPRSAQPSPALIESDDSFDFLSPREPEPERAPPPPSLRQRNGKCPGCDIRKPLWGYDGGKFLCRQCRHPSDIPKPAEPNTQASVDAAMAEFEAIKAQTF